MKQQLSIHLEKRSQNETYLIEFGIFRLQNWKKLVSNISAILLK
jgi:hypothetical protein